MVENEVATAESTAVEKFIGPAQDAIFDAIGPTDEIQILSDEVYDKVGKALVVVRTKRKELAAYFKEAPPEKHGPGQGLCYFARKAWDAANCLFNRFDSELKGFEEGLNGSMRTYRAEVERKAREEAEAKARKERERLAAEASEIRRKAEEDRRQREAELAEQSRIAEIERQKRLEAERKTANSERERRAAEQRAKQEIERIERDQREQQEAAEAKQRESEQEALMFEEQSRHVEAKVEFKAPTSGAVEIRKAWKTEVTDLRALCASVAGGTAPEWLVSANQLACDKLAAAAKGKGAPAGLRFYEAEIISKKKGK